MDHIFRVLPAVLRRRGLQGHAEAALVVHRAQCWIDQRLATFKGAITASHFENGVLTLCSTHSIASQEAHACIPDLLSFLNQECPFAPPKEVRIVREMERRKH